MKKGLVARLTVSIILIAIYTSVKSTFFVTFNNRLAVQQLQNDNVAFAEYTAFNNLISYSWIVILAVIILIHYRDIKRLLKKIFTT